MKSSIKVDTRTHRNTGEGFEAAIVVKVALDSDDLRDKMLKSFFEQLGHESKYALVKPTGYIAQDFSTYEIYPIRPDELNMILSK